MPLLFSWLILCICIWNPRVNPILHTWWLDNHALTLTNYTAKYYFGEKSKSLHTFLTFRPESRKIKFKLIKFLFAML